MVLAVISNRDLPKVNQLVLEVDPEAFMIVSQINEVRGRGFDPEQALPQGCSEQINREFPAQ